MKHYWESRCECSWRSVRWFRRAFCGTVKVYRSPFDLPSCPSGSCESFSGYTTRTNRLSLSSISLRFASRRTKAHLITSPVDSESDCPIESHYPACILTHQTLRRINGLRDWISPTFRFAHFDEARHSSTETISHSHSKAAPTFLCEKLACSENFYFFSFQSFKRCSLSKITNKQQLKCRQIDWLIDTIQTLSIDLFIKSDYSTSHSFQMHTRNYNRKTKNDWWFSQIKLIQEKLRKTRKSLKYPKGFNQTNK